MHLFFSTDLVGDGFFVPNIFIYTFWWFLAGEADNSDFLILGLLGLFDTELRVFDPGSIYPNC